MTPQPTELTKFTPTALIPGLAIIALKKMLGRGQQRTMGVKVSKGNIVTFVDSDDLLDDRFALEKISDEMKAADFIAFSKYKRLSDERCVVETSCYDGSESAYEWAMMHPLRYLGKPPYALKKNLFMQCGGFNETFRWGEGVSFWRKVLSLGVNFKLIDDCVYVVREHSGERVSKIGSLTKRQGKRVVFNVVHNALNEHQEYFNGHPVSRCIWLLFLIKKAKGMRDLRVFLFMSGKLLRSGLIPVIKAKRLIRTREVREG